MSFAPTVARQAFTLLTSGSLSSVTCTPKTGSVVSHGSDTELEMSVGSGGGFNQAVDVSRIGDATTRVGLRSGEATIVARYSRVWRWTTLFDDMSCVHEIGTISSVRGGPDSQWRSRKQLGVCSARGIAGAGPLPAENSFKVLAEFPDRKGRWYSVSALRVV